MAIVGTLSRKDLHEGLGHLVRAEEGYLLSCLAVHIAALRCGVFSDYACLEKKMRSLGELYLEYGLTAMSEREERALVRKAAEFAPGLRVKSVIRIQSYGASGMSTVSYSRSPEAVRVAEQALSFAKAAIRASA